MKPEEPELGEEPHERSGQDRPRSKAGARGEASARQPSRSPRRSAVRAPRKDARPPPRGPSGPVVGPSQEALPAPARAEAPEASAPQLSVVTVKAPARAPAPREALVERASAQAQGLLATNTCSQVLVVYSEAGAHLYFDGPAPKSGNNKTG